MEKIDPFFFQQISNKIENFYSQKDFISVEIYLNELLKKYDYLELYLFLWDHFLLIANYKKLKWISDYLISKNQSSWYYYRGCIFSHNDYFKQAIPDLEKANELEKNNPLILRELWYCYGLTNNLAKWLSLLYRAYNIAKYLQLDKITLLEIENDFNLLNELMKNLNNKS